MYCLLFFKIESFFALELGEKFRRIERSTNNCVTSKGAQFLLLVKVILISAANVSFQLISRGH